MEKTNEASTDPQVNSRTWWEDYFSHDWEKNEGSAQTRHFMERLIDNLPVEATTFMQLPDVRILDWGCAFGEGVALLGERFPRAHVAGLDFALRAVEEARKRYPSADFLHTEDG